MSTIVVSNALQEWYPEIFWKLTAALREEGHQWRFGGDPKNIWTRDYFENPFCYRHRQRADDILLDGGNMVESAKHVLMTSVVQKQNPLGTVKRIEAKLQKQAVVLPIEPEDTLGHADGIVCFIDERNVLINDYSVMQETRWSRYQKKLARRLEQAGLTAHTFPFAYHKCPQMTKAQFRHAYPNGDAYGPCCGYYINMLVLPNLVLLPVFGFAEDERAVIQAQGHFNRKVVAINCFELAMLGGCIRCVTKEAE